MESCAVPGADARIWRVVEVRQRENDRADAQNRPEYADRKWVQDLTHPGPNVVISRKSAFVRVHE